MAVMTKLTWMLLSMPSSNGETWKAEPIFLFLCPAGSGKLTVENLEKEMHAEDRE